MNNVDATRLETGVYTQRGGFDDIIFNGPRAESPDWADTEPLIDQVLQSARGVLVNGGWMHFSGTPAMPGGKHLNNLVIR